jgi:hypothetical protein
MLIPVALRKPGAALVDVMRAARRRVARARRWKEANMLLLA